MNKARKYRRILLIFVPVFLVGLVLFIAYIKAKEYEEKLVSELRSQIADQKANLYEQQTKINELEGEISNLKSSQPKSDLATKDEANKEEVITSASISNQIYCQTNADRYTKKDYDAYEDRIGDTRDSCIDKNSSSCDKAVGRAKKSFENFKTEYEAYHKKCD